MAANLRKLGVHGVNKPAKTPDVVTAADFAIGGMLGLFSRRFKIPFAVRNIVELAEIFGDNEVSTAYCWDAAKGFFENAAGVGAKLYALGHVGYDGAAHDGVAATNTLLDAIAANTLRVDSAFQEEIDYSTWGNRTGYTILNGTRFTTAANGDGIAADEFAILDSVSDIKVGDIVKFTASGGGGAIVYKKITAVDESLGRVSFIGAFDGAANLADNDVVSVPGFQLQLYRKSISGIESKVEEDLGKIWCTMEDEVTDYYVESVFSKSKNIVATDLDSASAIGSTFPINVATVTYLTAGANGTAPTTSAHWATSLSAFDDLPIRIIGNPETTDVDIQKAIETYLKARDDTPIEVTNVAEDQTKAQYTTIGNNYQRSDDVMQVVVADWLKVDDPFSTSKLAPKRNIPNVGHVMGAWIRCIETYGIHYIPSIRSLPLYGISGIVRETVWDDDDRTDLAEAGINIIGFVQGSGYLIRNFFTPSTTIAYQFANGLLMRNYFKVSAEDSLQSSENTPNSFKRIKSNEDAIRNFALRLWRNGSTGTVPEGETYGQGENEDGTPTKWYDHIQTQADAINNPQAGINSGERNILLYISYPAPAGSIQIGVGILLRG